jgi:hypothetical protein
MLVDHARVEWLGAAVGRLGLIPPAGHRGEGARVDEDPGQVGPVVGPLELVGGQPLILGHRPPQIRPGLGRPVAKAMRPRAS